MERRPSKQEIIKYLTASSALILLCSTLLFYQAGINQPSPTQSTMVATHTVETVTQTPPLPKGCNPPNISAPPMHEHFQIIELGESVFPDNRYLSISNIQGRLVIVSNYAPDGQIVGEIEIPNKGDSLHGFTVVVPRPGGIYKHGITVYRCGDRVWIYWLRDKYRRPPPHSQTPTPQEI